MISNVSDLVKAIRISDSESDAIKTYTKTLGFSDQWISSIYNTMGKIPELDVSFDVNLAGKAILQKFGFDEDIQSIMWEKWLTLEDEIKSVWIEDFNQLDQSDEGEVNEFLRVIVKSLSS